MRVPESRSEINSYESALSLSHFLFPSVREKERDRDKGRERKRVSENEDQGRK